MGWERETIRGERQPLTPVSLSLRTRENLSLRTQESPPHRPTQPFSDQHRHRALLTRWAIINFKDHHYCHLHCHRNTIHIHHNISVLSDQGSQLIRKFTFPQIRGHFLFLIFHHDFSCLVIFPKMFSHILVFSSYSGDISGLIFLKQLSKKIVLIFYLIV